LLRALLEVAEELGEQLFVELQLALFDGLNDVLLIISQEEEAATVATRAQLFAAARSEDLLLVHRQAQTFDQI